jgi:hypothetical protein
METQITGKQGFLRSWHEDRGFGIVIVTRQERYLLHISQIFEGPDNPPVGSTVIFDVGKAFKEGSLPQATNAKIILPDQDSKGGE